MLKFSFITAYIFSSFYFSIAHASSEGDVVIIKETPNAIYEGSSEHNRLNKKFQASLIAVGFGPVPGTTSGVNLSYSLDRNSLINLSYVGIYQSAYTCSGSISCDSTGNAITLSYKRFASNSFYYTLGLGRREVGYSERDTYTGTINYKVNGNALGAEISIGNQWQWQSFTLGCDWIGFNFPLSHKVESEESTTDSWHQNNLASKKRTLLETTAGLGLRFYLGASF